MQWAIAKVFNFSDSRKKNFYTKLLLQQKVFLINKHRKGICIEDTLKDSHGISISLLFIISFGGVLNEAAGTT